MIRLMEAHLQNLEEKGGSLNPDLDLKIQNIYTQVEMALASNAAYLANTSPTQADVVQQVYRLTRQVQALIRLQVRALDDISDTL